MACWVYVRHTFYTLTKPTIYTTSHTLNTKITESPNGLNNNVSAKPIQFRKNVCHLSVSFIIIYFIYNIQSLYVHSIACVSVYVVQNVRLFEMSSFFGWERAHHHHHQHTFSAKEPKCCSFWDVCAFFPSVIYHLFSSSSIFLFSSSFRRSSHQNQI